MHTSAVNAVTEGSSTFFPKTDAPQSNKSHSFMGMISGSVDMLRAFELIKKVAKANSTVLILGESGTGKELVAKALHRLSGRTGKLVPVNCGAIPEDILESELFGHEKGAFTGAVSSRMGRFELADGGTIFLDEIGDMSPKLQVKLLRVLQERKIEPVGSTRSISLNVRIITATNKDLREEVKAGRFREDLYYRLQVVPVELPALKVRDNDIMILAKHFMEEACKELGKNSISFTPEVEACLSAYNWPGNIRELENLIERLSILCETSSVHLSDLPDYIISSEELTSLVPNISALPEEGVDFNKLVNDFENRLITSALEKTSGNKKAAARLLNLNRTTLVEKIKKKGLNGSIEIIREQSCK